MHSVSPRPLYFLISKRHSIQLVVQLCGSASLKHAPEKFIPPIQSLYGNSRVDAYSDLSPGFMEIALFHMIVVIVIFSRAMDSMN